MAQDKAIQALKSRDPNLRRRAIKALGKSLNVDALPHLHDVYRNDEDPDIRELARKAGAYIQKNTRPIYEDEGYDDGYGEDLYDPYGAEEETATPGMDLIDQALDQYTVARYEDAQATLQQAFTRYPALIRNSEARSTAAQITGQPADVAIRALTRTQEQAQNTASTRRRLTFRPKTILFAALMVAMLSAGLTGISAFLPWMELEAVGPENYTAMQIAANEDETAMILSLPNVFDTITQGDVSNMNLSVATSRDLLSYSLYLIPLLGFGSILAAAFSMVNTPGPMFWGGMLLAAGGAGFGFWWYNDAINGLVELLFLSGDQLAGIATPNALIASGFDLGRAAVLIMAGASAIGLSLSFFVEQDT